MTRIDAEALEKALDAMMASVMNYDGVSGRSYQEVMLRAALGAYLSALPATGGVGTYADALKKAAQVAGNQYRGHSRELGTARARNYEHAGSRIEQAILALAPSAIQGHESREQAELIKEALRNLEYACEALAAGRSLAAYTAMVDGGQAQALLALDAARRNARSILSAQSSKSSEAAVTTNILESREPEGSLEVEPAVRDRFWLELREPGCVPQIKGPFSVQKTRPILREFFEARPAAFITVITLGYEGPNVQDAPEWLEVLDGRSASVAARHRKTSKEAHAQLAPLAVKTITALLNFPGGMYAPALERQAREALAALSAQSSPESLANGSSDKFDGAGTPEGWVLVPKDPDAAMLSAFQKRMVREFGIHATTGYFYRIYAAMLAAAPSPPPRESSEEGSRCEHRNRDPKHDDGTEICRDCGSLVGLP